MQMWLLVLQGLCVASVLLRILGWSCLHISSPSRPCVPEGQRWGLFHVYILGAQQCDYFLHLGWWFSNVNTPDSLASPTSSEFPIQQTWGKDERRVVRTFLTSPPGAAAELGFTGENHHKLVQHILRAMRSVVPGSLRSHSCSLPASSVRGILQVRILEWV